MKQGIEDAFEIWWEKLKNLRHKFCRETHLIGYEKEDIEQECYFIFRAAWEDYDESLGVSFGTYYRVKLYGWRANMNRKIKARQLVLLEDTAECSNESVCIEDETISRLLCERCLNHLTGAEYDLVYDYYILQVPLKVVAERLGLKYKYAEKQKKKALDKLRALVCSC